MEVIFYKIPNISIYIYDLKRKINNNICIREIKKIKKKSCNQSCLLLLSPLYIKIVPYGLSDDEKGDKKKENFLSGKVHNSCA